MTKNIVVFGGTGNQGSAFVRALTAFNTPSIKYNLHVLARSESGSALASLPGVTIVHVKDYADRPTDAFEATGLKPGEVYGVYDVQGYMHEEKDEAQAKGIVDVAVEYGVKHFIYASIDHDDTLEIGDDGIDAKRHVEKYIKSKGIGYTMLRSTDFMDNWVPTAAFTMKVYRTVLLRNTFSDKNAKLNMVAIADVGRMGAKAIANPETFMNKCIPLVGDALTMEQVESTYKSIMGKPVDETWGILASLTKWLEPQVGKLSKFYDTKGYASDMSQTKEYLPDVENFETFLTRYKREHAE